MRHHVALGRLWADYTDRYYLSSAGTEWHDVESEDRSWLDGYWAEYVLLGLPLDWLGYRVAVERLAGGKGKRIEYERVLLVGLGVVAAVEPINNLRGWVSLTTKYFAVAARAEEGGPDTTLNTSGVVVSPGVAVYYAIMGRVSVGIAAEYSVWASDSTMEFEVADGVDHTYTSGERGTEVSAWRVMPSVGVEF